MKASPDASASVRLAHYGAFLRRRWRIIIGVTLCGLTAGMGTLLFVPTRYTATTSVLVSPTGVQDPTPLANGRAPAEINLDTEAQIATSTEVARRVQKMMQLDISTENLLEHVSITVPPNSAILEISYHATTQRAARLASRSFAQAYIRHRGDVARARVERRVKALQEKIKKKTDKIGSVASRISAAPGGTSAHLLARTRRNWLAQQVSALNSRVSALTTKSITPGTIISAARLPAQPSGPSFPLHATTGLMSGLLVGIVTGQLRDRTDTRIRRAADVAQLTGLPVLLNVQDRQEKLRLAHKRSRFGQGFHELGRSLTATLGRGQHVVVVTGTCPGGGGSAIAVNLAMALARSGSHTVLICADMASSQAARLVGLQGGPGLSESLLYGTPVSALEQRVPDQPRLRVLLPGLQRELTAEYLQSPLMQQLLRTVRHAATYVVVEAPAISDSADAQALAESSDATVVVVEVPRAERARTRQGVQRLSEVGTAVLGAVVISDQFHRAPAREGDRDGEIGRHEMDTAKPVEHRKGARS